MGCPGGQPQGSRDSEGGLYPTLPHKTQPVQTATDYKSLPKLHQEPISSRFGSELTGQTGCGGGREAEISRFLQPVISGPKTQRPVEAHLGFEHLKHLFENKQIQNGNTRIYKNLPASRGVGHLCRFQGRLLSPTNTPSLQKVPEVSHPRSNLSVQGSPLWSVDSSYGVHLHSQRGQTYGPEQRYKDPPVPRRLVGESLVLPILSPTDPGPGVFVPGSGLGGKPGEIRTRTQTGIRFRRLPIRPEDLQGQTDRSSLVCHQSQNSDSSTPTVLHSQSSHVSNRLIDSHRETGSFRSASHEAHSVAPQKQLEGPTIPVQGHTYTQISTQAPKVVVTGRKRPFRSTTTPSRACPADLYRRLRRRLGRSLKRSYSKRLMEPPRNQTAYQLSRIEGSIPGFERIQAPLHQQSGAGSHRQHHCGRIHKQTGGHEVRPIVCPPVENSYLVQQQPGGPTSQTYTWETQCHSRQTLQTRSDHPDRVVSPPRCVSGDMLQVAPSYSGPVCHQIQQQTVSVCVPSSRPTGLGSGCPQPVLGPLGPLCISTSSHLGQSGGEADGQPLQQNDSDCSRVAQHALVLGSGDHVEPDSSLPAQPAQPSDSTIQSDLTQEFDQSEPPCLAPRASRIKEQGFSEAVAARIEAPQRRSTRSVYEAKWTIFTKWCDSHQVDFRSPPIKAIADFLLYLFEDKHLQPSTIDGYRSAIAYKVGSLTVNIRKDENLTRTSEIHV